MNEGPLKPTTEALPDGSDGSIDKVEESVLGKRMREYFERFVAAANHGVFLLRTGSLVLEDLINAYSSLINKPESLSQRQLEMADVARKAISSLQDSVFAAVAGILKVPAKIDRRKPPGENPDLDINVFNVLSELQDQIRQIVLKNFAQSEITQRNMPSIRGVVIRELIKKAKSVRINLPETIDVGSKYNFARILGVISIVESSSITGILSQIVDESLSEIFSLKTGVITQSALETALSSFMKRIHRDVYLSNSHSYGKFTASSRVVRLDNVQDIINSHLKSETRDLIPVELENLAQGLEMQSVLSLAHSHLDKLSKGRKLIELLKKDNRIYERSPFKKISSSIRSMFFGRRDNQPENVIDGQRLIKLIHEISIIDELALDIFAVILGYHDRSALKIELSNKIDTPEELRLRQLLKQHLLPLVRKNQNNEFGLIDFDDKPRHFTLMIRGEIFQIEYYDGKQMVVEGLIQAQIEQAFAQLNNSNLLPEEREKFIKARKDLSTIYKALMDHPNKYKIINNSARPVTEKPSRILKANKANYSKINDLETFLAYSLLGDDGFSLDERAKMIGSFADAIRSMIRSDYILSVGALEVGDGGYPYGIGGELGLDLGLGGVCQQDVTARVDRSDGGIGIRLTSVFEHSVYDGREGSGKTGEDASMLESSSTNPINILALIRNDPPALVPDSKLKKLFSPIYSSEDSLISMFKDRNPDLGRPTDFVQEFVIGGQLAKSPTGLRESLRLLLEISQKETGLLIKQDLEAIEDPKILLNEVNGLFGKVRDIAVEIIFDMISEEEWIKRLEEEFKKSGGDLDQRKIRQIKVAFEQELRAKILQSNELTDFLIRNIEGLSEVSADVDKKLSLTDDLNSFVVEIKDWLDEELSGWQTLLKPIRGSQLKSIRKKIESISSTLSIIESIRQNTDPESLIKKVVLTRRFYSQIKALLVGINKEKRVNSDFSSSDAFNKLTEFWNESLLGLDQNAIDRRLELLNHNLTSRITKEEDIDFYNNIMTQRSAEKILINIGEVLANSLFEYKAGRESIIASANLNVGELTKGLTASFIAHISILLSESMHSSNLPESSRAFAIEMSNMLSVVADPKRRLDYFSLFANVELFSAFENFIKLTKGLKKEYIDNNQSSKILEILKESWGNLVLRCIESSFIYNQELERARSLSEISLVTASTSKFTEDLLNQILRVIAPDILNKFKTDLFLSLVHSNSDVQSISLEDMSILIMDEAQKNPAFREKLDDARNIVMALLQAETEGIRSSNTIAVTLEDLKRKYDSDLVDRLHAKILVGLFSQEKPTSDTFQTVIVEEVKMAFAGIIQHSKERKGISINVRMPNNAQMVAAIRKELKGTDEWVNADTNEKRRELINSRIKEKMREQMGELHGTMMLMFRMMNCTKSEFEDIYERWLEDNSSVSFYDFLDADNLNISMFGKKLKPGQPGFLELQL